MLNLYLLLLGLATLLLALSSLGTMAGARRSSLPAAQRLLGIPVRTLAGESRQGSRNR